MKSIWLVLFAILTSCTSTANFSSTAFQKSTYKNWVLSRCISKIATDEKLKQDALNSASAYLEQSDLSVDAVTNADPLIDSFLQRNYQGSIPGTFNTKKCIDLFNSNELDQLYLKERVKK
jgi:hypothetical protein